MERCTALTAVGQEQHALAVRFFAPRFQREQIVIDCQALGILALREMLLGAQAQPLYEQIMQVTPLG